MATKRPYTIESWERFVELMQAHIAQCTKHSASITEINKRLDGIDTNITSITNIVNKLKEQSNFFSDGVLSKEHGGTGTNTGVPEKIEIPANADLNNYRDEGWYYCNKAADAVTMKNCPTGFAFVLFVCKTFKNNDAGQIVQIIRSAGTDKALYHRTTTGGNATAWYDWRQVRNADDVNDYTTGINLIRGSRDFELGKTSELSNTSDFIGKTDGFSDKKNAWSFYVDNEGFTVASATRSTTSGGIIALASSVVSASPNELFTLSYEFKIEDDPVWDEENYTTASIGYWNASNTRVAWVDVTQTRTNDAVYTVDPVTGWTKVRMQFKVASNSDIDKLSVSLFLYKNGSVSFRKLMVQRGHINNPIWAPHPLDSGAYMDNTEFQSYLASTATVTSELATSTQGMTNMFDNLVSRGMAVVRAENIRELLISTTINMFARQWYWGNATYDEATGTLSPDPGPLASRENNVYLNTETGMAYAYFNGKWHLLWDVAGSLPGGGLPDLGDLGSYDQLGDLADDIGKSLNPSDYDYLVGQTLSTSVSGYGNLPFRVWGIKADGDASGNISSITFGCDYTVGNVSHPLFTAGGNGYNTCESFYSAIDANFRKLIKEIQKKYTSATSYTTPSGERWRLELININGHVFTPSNMELAIPVVDSIDVGTTYQYFADGNTGKIPNKTTAGALTRFWLRQRYHSYNVSGYSYCNENGNMLGSSGANNVSMGFVPTFSI